MWLNVSEILKLELLGGGDGDGLSNHVKIIMFLFSILTSLIYLLLLDCDFLLLEKILNPIHLPS